MSETRTDSNPGVMAFSLLRAAIGLVLAVVYTFFVCCWVFVFGALELHHIANPVVRAWGRGVLWIFGVRLVVEGEENLPKSGGAIVVFNHQSHFDILAISGSTPKTLRFGAKIELFKIPIFGAAMRASGCLPIARNNRSEVLRVYRDAEKKFTENFLFCLAPEGTRQESPVLGRFKKGPAVFALNGGVPLIPVVLKGAFSVVPKGSLAVNVGRLTRTIHVRYLKPIQTAGSTLTADELTNLARAQMVSAYDELPSEDEDEGLKHWSDVENA